MEGSGNDSEHRPGSLLCCVPADAFRDRLDQGWSRRPGAWFRKQKTSALPGTYSVGHLEIDILPFASVEQNWTKRVNRGQNIPSGQTAPPQSLWDNASQSHADISSAQASSA